MVFVTLRNFVERCIRDGEKKLLELMINSADFLIDLRDAVTRDPHRCNDCLGVLTLSLEFTDLFR